MFDSFSSLMDHEARRMLFRSGLIDEMVTACPLSPVVESEAFRTSLFLRSTAGELELSPGQVSNVCVEFGAWKELRLLVRRIESWETPTCK